MVTAQKYEQSEIRSPWNILRLENLTLVKLPMDIIERSALQPAGTVYSDAVSTRE